MRLFRRNVDPESGDLQGRRGPTPEEDEALLAGLDRLAEEKRKALADPGPDWRTWFFHDHARWWVGLLFLIVDVWIAGTFLQPLDLYLLVPSLGFALYLEYVAYMYLWRRPDEEALARGVRHRRTWWSPFEYGRWTPEAARARTGPPLTGVAADAGPDPHEFL